MRRIGKDERDSLLSRLENLQLLEPAGTMEPITKVAAVESEAPEDVLQDLLNMLKTAEEAQPEESEEEAPAEEEEAPEEAEVEPVEEEAVPVEGVPAEAPPPVAPEAAAEAVPAEAAPINAATLQAAAAQAVEAAAAQQQAADEAADVAEALQTAAAQVAGVPEAMPQELPPEAMLPPDAAVGKVAQLIENDILEAVGQAAAGDDLLEFAQKLAALRRRVYGSANAAVKVASIENPFLQRFLDSGEGA